MSARVDPDGAAGAPLALPAPGTIAPPPAVAIDVDDRYEAASLPSDHPAWLRDAVALSQRARAAIAALKPIAVRVFAAWDHRVRSTVVAGRTLHVDASGSYRVS